MRTESLDLTLWFIRHGESVANSKNITIGQDATEPLSERGKQQAKLLGARLRDEVEFYAVYASPYTRAQHTLTIAEPKVNGIYGTGVEDLREINQGSFLGKDRSELTNDPELWARYKRNGMGFAFPNGESPFDVAHRAFNWITKEILTAPHIRRDRPIDIGLFTHGMTTKATLWSIMQWDHRMTGRVHIDNTSISKVHLKHGDWFLLSINDTSHLTKELRT